MEIVFVMVGMVLAFFAGAYVREPFCLKTKQEEEVSEEKEFLTEKDRQAEQMNNLMNYNGRKQYSEEE